MVSSKQPVPHLQLGLVFLRSLFQKSIVIIFLFKDSLAQVLDKYVVTEASGFTPIHRGERCPSSQVLLFAVTRPSTIVKQRQSSQMEKKKNNKTAHKLVPSDILQSEDQVFFH